MHPRPCRLPKPSHCLLSIIQTLQMLNYFIVQLELPPPLLPMCRSLGKCRKMCQDAPTEMSNHVTNKHNCIKNIRWQLPHTSRIRVIQTSSGLSAASREPVLFWMPPAELWSGHFHFGRARMARVGVMKLKVPPWRIGNLKVRGQGCHLWFCTKTDLKQTACMSFSPSLLLHLLPLPKFVFRKIKAASVR